MKLYIANTTKQVHDFVYRVPGEARTDQSTGNGLRTQKIDPGGQILVHRDMSKAEVDGIVDQHARYGLVAANEIVRTRGFIGLCYSVDDPVDLEKFMVAEDHNRSVLENRGVEIRKVGAVAVNQRLAQDTQGLSSLEFETTEEPPRSGLDLAERRQETIAVVPDPTSPGRRGKRGS